MVVVHFVYSYSGSSVLLKVIYYSYLELVDQDLKTMIMIAVKTLRLFIKTHLKSQTTTQMKRKYFGVVFKVFKF